MKSLLRILIYTIKAAVVLASLVLIAYGTVFAAYILNDLMDQDSNRKSITVDYLPPVAALSLGFLLLASKNRVVRRISLFVLLVTVVFFSTQGMLEFFEAKNISYKVRNADEVRFINYWKNIDRSLTQEEVLLVASETEKLSPTIKAAKTLSVLFLGRMICMCLGHGSLIVIHGNGETKYFFTHDEVNSRHFFEIRVNEAIITDLTARLTENSMRTAPTAQ